MTTDVVILAHSLLIGLVFLAYRTHKTHRAVTLAHRAWVFLLKFFMGEERRKEGKEEKGRKRENVFLAHRPGYPCPPVCLSFPTAPTGLWAIRPGCPCSQFSWAWKEEKKRKREKKVLHHRSGCPSPKAWLFLTTGSAL